MEKLYKCLYIYISQISVISCIFCILMKINYNTRRNDDFYAYTVQSEIVTMYIKFKGSKLQSILGIRWWHRKTHTEIRETCKIESVELLLLQRQRLPCCLLSGELQLGQRPVGRPKLRYSDHIKSVLRKCNIPEAQLEALAEDMFLWSLTCATGLKNLAAAAAEQAASDLRARRHAAATATPAGPVCPYCGRICASDFGLRSHLRVHL